MRRSRGWFRGEGAAALNQKKKKKKYGGTRKKPWKGYGGVGEDNYLSESENKKKIIMPIHQFNQVLFFPLPVL